VKECGLEEEEI